MMLQAYLRRAPTTTRNALLHAVNAARRQTRHATTTHNPHTNTTNNNTPRRTKLHAVRAFRSAPTAATPADPPATAADDTIEVDQVARLYSFKVPNERAAVQADLAVDEYIKNVVAAMYDGYDLPSASRLVCKTHWEYKMILKLDAPEAL